MSAEDRLLTRFGTRRRTWRIRAQLRRARFAFSRGAFQTSHAFEETSARLQAIPYLIRNAILPVALALALVIAMDLLDSTLSDRIASWGWSSSEGTYDALFETVAAVTGVFLALYFTAVSTVAASVYVNVPHDIRALIVRDRLGNVYVMGVAFTMALSVLLLIAHALTGRTYESGPPVVGVFAAFSIFAFIRLGQRAFYLADPTLLSGTLAHDFGSWFRRTTVEGRRWDDPNFQEHYRRRARQSVESLASLLAIGADQPHLRGGSVRQLTAQITGLLTGYLMLRDLVPTKSRWFGERYQHKQWYLTDSTELDSASATATALHPQSVPYVTWVEDELIAPLVDLIEGDLKHKDFEGAYVALGQLERVWTLLGERWSGQDAARWLSTLTARVTDQLSATEHPSISSRPALVPAVWDALGMLPMASELGFHRNVTSRSVAELVTELESTDWSKETAPYRMGVPRSVVGVLEELRRGRAFESAVNAPALTRTPTWYARELALHAYERAFHEEIAALVDLLADWYPTTAQKLTDALMPDAAGAVLSRGIEAVWKLERHVVEWEQIATDLRNGPLLVDLVRPTWDWPAIRQKITDLRTDLLCQLSRSIPLQALRQRDPEVPDYLGEAVHRVGEAAFEALAHNDDALFAQLFPTYFIGVLVIVDRIKPQVTTWQPSVAATAISEPVADVLDLSGYALIFSELHANPKLRETCETSWREYLGEAEGRERLAGVAAMHRYQRNLFAITHRTTARTRWRMAANSALNELPRSMPSHPFGDGQVQHRSALIRKIAPHGSLLYTAYQPSDVFVVWFLRNFPGGECLDFGLRDRIVDEIPRQSEDEVLLKAEETPGQTSPGTSHPANDETDAGSDQ